MELLIPHCNFMSSEPICLLEVNAAMGSCKALSAEKAMSTKVMTLDHLFESLFHLLIVHDLTYYCNTAAIFLRETRIAAAAHLSWTEHAG